MNPKFPGNKAKPKGQGHIAVGEKKQSNKKKGDSNEAKENKSSKKTFRVF